MQRAEPFVFLGIEGGPPIAYSFSGVQEIAIMRRILAWHLLREVLSALIVIMPIGVVLLLEISF
jgi:hypothetical protein